MSSFVYNSYWHDIARGLIVDGTATFKVALLTNGYTADENAKDTHLVMTTPIASQATFGGLTGYADGGSAATVTIAKVTASNTITFTLQGATWTTSAGGTLTARHAIWYVVVGSNATNRVIAINDFGSDQIASNGGTLTLPASVITLTN